MSVFLVNHIQVFVRLFFFSGSISINFVQCVLEVKNLVFTPLSLNLGGHPSFILIFFKIEICINFFQYTFNRLSDLWVLLLWLCLFFDSDIKIVYLKLFYKFVLNFCRDRLEVLEEEMVYPYTHFPGVLQKWSC